MPAGQAIMLQEKEHWIESHMCISTWRFHRFLSKRTWPKSRYVGWERVTPPMLYLCQSSNFNECHHHLPRCPTQLCQQHSLLLILPYTPRLINNQVLCEGAFQTSPRVHSPLLCYGTTWSRLPSPLTCFSAVASWLFSCLKDVAYCNPFFTLQPESPFCSMKLSFPFHYML